MPQTLSRAGQDPELITTPMAVTKQSGFNPPRRQLRDVLEAPTTSPVGEVNALEPAPGDCFVAEFVRDNATPFLGEPSFLAGPTERTNRAWDRVQELAKAERDNGGVLDVDTETVPSITAFKPGYVLSKEEDVIVGLMSDAPLKRICKPRGGFKMVEDALKSYGFKHDERMKEIYTKHVTTHNTAVFNMYT